MSEILVHNNWDPLEEIWLGDVWPAHFYDDIKDSRIRDSFYQLTEWTKQDLNALQKKFEEFGVVVRRPYVDGDKSLYLDKNKNRQSYNKLLRPPITPRDENCVIGNKLYFGDSYLINAYRPLLNYYNSDSVTVSSSTNPTVSGASTVKLGKDILFDSVLGPENIIKRAKPNTLKELIFARYRYFSELVVPQFEQDYRIHMATNGGHCDGCFMPVKPGVLVTTEYWKDYDVVFPDWKKFNLTDPTYAKETRFWRSNPRWHLPGMNSMPHFNDYLERFCPEWVGNFKETYFEVNFVMVDEKNMICMGEHESLFKELSKLGVTPHIVPFRTRTFWDGGIHCITLDIRRKSTLQDYFPNRGSMGFKNLLSEGLFPSMEIFMQEYKAWHKMCQEKYGSEFTDDYFTIRRHIFESMNK